MVVDGTPVEAPWFPVTCTSCPPLPMTEMALPSVSTLLLLLPEYVPGATITVSPLVALLIPCCESTTHTRHKQLECRGGPPWTAAPRSGTENMACTHLNGSKGRLGRRPCIIVVAQS